jgi:uncharacterized membrane protein YraQ (UPF0718 family)
MKGKRGEMEYSHLWVLFAMTGIAAVIAYLIKPSLVLEGLKDGGMFFWQVIPILIPAFIMGGLIAKMLPGDAISKWVGAHSGLRGMVIATLGGALTPGGPIVQFPIIALLYQKGMGVGPLTAYVSAWSLIQIQRFLFMELPLLGWQLAIVRIVASLVFPVIIGFVAEIMWSALGKG